MFEFSYLKNEDLEKYAWDLFSILYDNMEKIVPTGNSSEEVFGHWLPAMQEQMQKGNRETILILHKETKKIAGYFQYSLRDNVFLMEEIEIDRAYQGKYRIFRNLYGFLIAHLGPDVEYVEAYANKKNVKSMGILGKLGLSIVGENKTGTGYHFRGTYSDLLKWYQEKET